MNVKLLKMLGLLMALVMAAAACGSSDESASSTGGDSSDVETDGEACEGRINASGSSTVEPITTRAAELYTDAGCNADITVDGPGTGDGFALFCSGETDISDASRTIKDEEAEDCTANGIEYTELLIAYDGIAVMTSPANTAVECLSFVDLYALLGGSSEGFGNWSDASDLGTELGSTVAPYPDAPLDISGPGTESGTYDSFIEIVLEGIGEEVEGEDGTFIRTDFSGNADDNVIIEGIAGGDTSLGWVGFAFAEENLDRIKEIQVSEEPGGDCVSPTIETIADGSYPVSRGLYIYVNNEKLESNPALRPFVEFMLSDGYVESVTKAFGESGYVPLPDDLLAEAVAAIG